MKILEDVLQSLINSSPQVPPECGGIIGGKDGVITENIFIDSKKSDYGCAYCLDTSKINIAIADWKEKGVEFYGIFHSHPPENSSLSVEDIFFIENIMQALKTNINWLYFPVVLPKDKILFHKAEWVDDKIVYTEEDLYIKRG